MAKKKKRKKKKTVFYRYFGDNKELKKPRRQELYTFAHFNKKRKNKALFDYCIFHGHKNTYGTAEVTGARRTKLVKKHWAGFSSAKDRILSH